VNTWDLAVLPILCPAGLPGRRAAPGHPHRASRDQHLPAPGRL